MRETTTAKEEAIKLIREMPDEVSTETVVAELNFKLIVEQRLEQVERGEVASHDEAKKSSANGSTCLGNSSRTRSRTHR